MSTVVARKPRRPKQSSKVAAEAKVKAERDIAAMTKKARHLWDQWQGLARKSATAYWHAGKMLAEVKQLVTETRKLTGTGWEQWCQANEIAKSTADQAIIVASKVKESDIESCDGITSAKVAAGIVPAKGRASSKPTPAAAQEVAPEHEPDTTLKILMRVIALLGEALKSKVRSDERGELMEEIINAHKLLDKLDEKVSK